MSSKAVKSNKLLLNGIFGLFKQSGDSIDDYKTWIRLTHYHESNIGPYSKGWSSPSIILDVVPKYAEPFTTGVLCVGIGFWATRLTALTKFWNHEWIVSAKLGIETKDYSSDSPIVREVPISHINEQLLTEALNDFIGAKEQLNPPYIWKDSLLIPKEPVRKRTEYALKCEPTPRIRECHTIEVLSFEPPDLRLRVISDGYFSCRTLVQDLGLQLKSCAHLTGLHLNRMGVISVDDCLQKYELHFSRISEAIDKYSKLCSRDLKQFKDLKADNRRVI